MLDGEGTALLRLVIFKMWSLMEARQNGDCQKMADEINSWMPPEFKITAYDVKRALSNGSDDTVTVNIELLRDKIDKLPALYSARLNGDYQAIYNEVRKDPELKNISLADVVEAMASRPVPQPTNVVQAKVGLVRV